MSTAFVIDGKINLNTSEVVSGLESVDKKVKSTSEQIDKNKQSTDEASKSTSNWTTKIASIGEGMASFGKKMTVGFTTPVMGIAALCTKAYSSLEQTQRRTKTIYGEMAEDVQAWALENERYFGLGAGTIENYAGQIGDLVQGLGMGKEESYAMAKGATELGVQLANWSGYNTEEVINDINKALTGSYEGMQKYGVKLNETALDQIAMNLGLGETYSELDNVGKAMVINQGIMDASSNAIDYWNEGNRSTSFYLTEVKEQIGNVSESIGQVLLPPVLEVIKSLGDVATKVAAWCSENPKLVETITKIVLAIAIAMPVIMTVGSVFSGITKTVNNVKNAMALLNPTVLIVVAVIAALIAIGVLLYQNWDTIKEKCEQFKGFILEKWQGIKDFFDGFKDWIGNVFATDWSEKFGFMGDVINGFLTNIQGYIEGVKRTFGGIIDFIKGVFTGDWELAWNGVKNIFGGIMDGLGSVIKAPLNAVISIINGCVSQINKLGIDIPDWVPGLGGKKFGINIPKIKYLYEGGIFTKPTVMGGGYGVGDAYKGKGNQAEAVVPIEKLKDMIRDVLQVEINFNVDGREFVREVVAPHQKEMQNYCIGR